MKQSGSMIQTSQPRLHFVNRLFCTPGETFGPRIICDHQFIYVEKGRGTAEIMGNKYTAEPGSLFYYGPGEPHRFEADGEEPFVLYGLHFSPDSVEGDDSAGSGSQQVTILPADSMDRLHPVPCAEKRLDGIPYCSNPGMWPKPLFEEMVKEYRTGDSYSGIVISCLLLQWKAKLYRWLEAAGPRPFPQKEEAAWIRHQLERHAYETYLPGWLEEWTPYGHDYASRMFRRAYGISPHAYHLQCKLQQAELLLQETDLTVTEISEKLNYGSVHYFSRWFKQQTGEQPTRYRQLKRWI
ncbi:helix-turn-helix domain-containing protein [Paenibacillus gansuensis]|uniref:Helix-turn-helix domain-containing protein n=1 Tax=Paenibacillus gansuensis TaxID=306542 RepID=A0ABW5PC70_9BACL